MRIVQRCLVVAAACVLGLPAGVAAQGRGQGQRPLSAAAAQNLDFGAIFPGLPEVVTPADALRAGRFTLRGSNRAEVAITMTLPASLIEPGGQTLALQWGPSDGAWNTQSDVATAQAFDPRVQLVARLAGNGRLFIYLGSTALPSATQRSGDYTGTITLSAAYTGN